MTMLSTHNRASASQPTVVEAPTLKEALRLVRARHGADARVIRSRTVTRRQSGGLGQHKLVEVLIETDAPGRVTTGSTPAVIVPPARRLELTSAIAAEVERIEELVRQIAARQAASGAGQSAMLEMIQQAREVLDGRPVTCKTLKYQLAFNVYCHDSKIGANGYNEEEMKMVHETHKIFSCPEIAITCTCVRIPVMRTHCESINIEFTSAMTPGQVRDLLNAAPGVSIIDDRENNRFPMPIDATGKDDVYVGRIRQDESVPGNRGINLWVAGDQIRKGAALNAIQIAELL